MYLYYNGINLDIVKVLDWEKRVVNSEDGIDYLWTKHKITIEAIYYSDTSTTIRSPVSKALQTEPGTLEVTAGAGTVSLSRTSVTGTRNAVATEVELRSILSQPRKKLVIWELSNVTTPPDITNPDPSEVIIECPLATSPCCLINGPHPVVNAIEETRGVKMFMVSFSIEFAVNEMYAFFPPERRTRNANTITGVVDSLAVGATYTSPPFTVQDPNPSGVVAPYIISNRWTSKLTYDEQYIATRTIIGTAVLRADLLKANLKEIDEFRLKLLPLPAAGTKRFLDELTVHSDGYTYTYVVRDVEQEFFYIDTPTRTNGSPALTPTNATTSGRPLKKRNVTHIEGYVKRSAGQNGTENLTKIAFSQARNLMSNMINLQKSAGNAAAGVASMSPSGLHLAFNGVLDAAEVIGQGAITSTENMYNAVSSLLPEIQEEVVVTVYGNKHARKSDLQYLAYSIAFGQLSNGTGFPSLGGLAAALGASFQSIADQINGDLGWIGRRLATAVNPGAILSEVTGSFIPTANSVTLQYDLMENKVTVMVAQSFSGLLDWTTNRASAGLRSLTDPIPETIVGGNWTGVLANTPASLTNAVAMNGAGVNFSQRVSRLPDTNLLIADKRKSFITNTAITPEDLAGIASGLSLLAPKLFGPIELHSVPYANAVDAMRIDNDFFGNVATGAGIFSGVIRTPADLGTMPAATSLPTTVLPTGPVAIPRIIATDNIPETPGLG